MLLYYSMIFVLCVSLVLLLRLLISLALVLFSWLELIGFKEEELSSCESCSSVGVLLLLLLLLFRNECAYDGGWLGNCDYRYSRDFVLSIVLVALFLCHGGEMQ